MSIYKSCNTPSYGLIRGISCRFYVVQFGLLVSMLAHEAAAPYGWSGGRGRFIFSALLFRWSALDLGECGGRGGISGEVTGEGSICQLGH